ncbi:MAG: hypothetical protein JKY65_16020 [Planctomycetes bacterium]|nr:hypothetical protein [Planctomycetota bacterium]
MRQRLVVLVGLGLLALCGASPASAGDDPVARYALSRFLECARTERWLEARESWKVLESLKSAPERLACLAAEAQLKGGELGEARRLLDPLLRAERPRVDALYLSARLSMQTGDTSAAKRDLLVAARNGQAVLHDVGFNPELAPLLRDVEFAIQVIEATRNAKLEPVWRNPFARDQHTPTQPPTVPRASLEGLRKALRVARERASARDLAGLDRALATLRREVEAAEAAAPGSSEGIYAEARAALDELGDRADSIRLQLFVGRGNQLLRLLAERSQESDLAGARDTRLEILQLCRRFEAGNQQIYRRTAARLRTRCEVIWLELEIRQEVLALKLPISGVVIPPPEERAPKRAIVDGYIVTEGDALAGDGMTTSREDPFAVLVESIQVGAVTFSYRGLKFVRRPRALKVSRPHQ